MNTKTINIENPSKETLNFFRTLRATKQARKVAYIAKKDIYFQKNK